MDKNEQIIENDKKEEIEESKLPLDQNFFMKVRLEEKESICNLSKQRVRAINYARGMYEQIKFKIIDAINTNKYSIMNDEVFVSVWCDFPQMYLKSFSIKSTKSSVSFKMDSEHIEEYDFMMTQLRKYLASERIKSKVRVLEKKTRKEFKFACDYRHISNNKKDYALGVLCTCTIPVEKIERINQYILAVSLSSSDKNQIDIKWNNIPKGKKYEIWRWEDHDNKVLLASSDKNCISYADKNIQYEIDYFYQVICTCENGEVIESSIESIRILDEVIDENINFEVMQDVDAMDGHEFERFCAKLLMSNGYEDVIVTRGSGDQGIDVIAFRDFVKFGIQCKCYSADIGNKAIQEAYAGKNYYDCHVGIVLTNRYFTKAAKELAKKSGIVLWDRAMLLKMIENINRKRAIL